MSKTSFPAPPPWWLFLRNRVAPIMILVYMAAALLAFVVIPVAAVRWINLPFIGAFVEQTLLLNTSSPTISGAWEIQKLSLIYGHQLFAIDDHMVTSDRQMEQVLANYQAGDEVQVKIKTPAGAIREEKVTLINFSVLDQVSYFAVPYLVGFIHLATGLWVFLLRRQDATGQAFAMFMTSVALGLAAFFDMQTTHYLTPLWTLAMALIGSSLINFSLLFPYEGQFILRYPYLRFVGYIPSVIMAILGWANLYNNADLTAYVVYSWRPIYIYAAVSFVFFIVWTILHLFSSPSPIVREQARWVMIGALVGFSLVVIFMPITVLFPSRVLFTPWLLLPMGLFPPLTAYSILRYRLLNTDYLLTRALLYAIMLAAAALSYGLLASGLMQLTNSVLRLSDPFVLGGLAAFLAILLFPLRDRLQRLVDGVFARGQSAYREELQIFGRELTRAMDLRGITGLLRQFVQKNIGPFQLHVFVHDPLSDHYIATPGENDGKPSSDLRFSANSPLVQSLSNRRNAIFLGESSTLPAALQPEQARLTLLGAKLFVPLPGRQRLTGWLALSDRRSGEPYGGRDLEFLESLCDQAALAVERAQVVGDLERRIHEMNVLSRVSQGINVTLAFDDMLELIFAQTFQIIPTQDFRITLNDNYSGILYHVFYLENDDRLTERENRPLALGQGLEQEVMKSRRPIVTDDYERECRGRGVLPSAQGMFSWIGVPLNAGAETIGVLSLGSRDPSAIFTEEQVNLLQAIADQAAGAIVKARLLQESERRARQLATLNEVARSLTSTLELEPLLNQILQSAVEILNCEAGSLLLVDQATGELVFEVVVGPPESANLLGQRLPPGTGLVGKAVDTRSPVIANDVRRSKEWFEKSDEQTGFKTNDLLVVPMEVKGEVSGVIEVINRRDGLPFSPDDQGLLTAFASQAAVAIDNARLYTQTDQTLAARVEELQVMQRIDRELNASLDVERAMRITLEWSMRQSKADAGLVGMLEESGLRIMASRGYSLELSAYRDSPMPIELSGMYTAVETGQVRCLQAESNNGNGAFALLKKARSQVVIPIRREVKVIGLMVLESLQAEACPEDVLAFLSRLSDHAAIAIANAQLYARIEAANRSKAEFVRFVAHELKNPMSPIKGFTEMILTGMAGPVNEMQASFLKTVRSNVNRIETIVQDLEDAAKIEGGRLALNFKPVQISEVIETIVRSMTQQIEEKQQRLVVNVPEDLPDVWADQTRLEQVLTNLVSNAYKYTPQGGQILLEAELTMSDPDKPDSIRVVHLWVKDSGIGISEEDQKKIFSQYFRTMISREIAQGTGLGLNITKSLVEMQGGRIWFESELQKGTTFHFTVPVAETA